MLFQTLSIPLKNEYLHKNKVKNPFSKIKEYQVRFIQKIKKINFFNPIFKNKAFLPYSKFLKWDY
ncbi:hypothetical protein F7218_06165 [Helicobacter pylori]|uniref:Uncharacterized protein n=1 Tax=Helicobacter pylori TaxID=210 RepID=A0A7K1P1S8_HELPX|nr:hypothetical protein [Helicobacter pylori]